MFASLYWPGGLLGVILWYVATFVANITNVPRKNHKNRAVAVQAVSLAEHGIPSC
jgi:TRAP-type C4-dicarboxylate transport system permease large subunit